MDRVTSPGEIRESLRNENPPFSAWGVLPIVSVLAAIGVALVSVGDSIARTGNQLADIPFWGGLLLVVVPVAFRLLSSDASRPERVGLVAVLGGSTYLVKILHSPTHFGLFDEFLHARTVADISQSGHLFLHNPLLTVSPAFPGLEIVTSAVAQMTGISTFDAGLAVIAVARLLLVLGLFLLFEEIGGSPRLAGIGTFIYATNPSFVFFDSQFAYESLALPLAILAILSALRWQRAERGRAPYAIVTLGAIAAVVMTHHLTSYVLIAFLGAWTIASRLVGRPHAWRVPALATAFGALVAGAWVPLYASEIIRYMEPRIAATLSLIGLLTGQAATRSLFQASSGIPAPDWERFTALATTALLLILLAFGLWRVWRDHRRDAIAVALALGALGYPASLALRLTVTGAEESTRIPEFVYLGVAFVGALVIAGLRRPTPPDRFPARNVAWAGVAGVVFCGGLVIGVPRWSRLPGPYLPSADSRSIEPQGITAASWSLRYLGPGTRIATDRVNRILMGGDGRQYPVTSYGDQVDTWRLFYTSSVDAVDRQIIRAGALSVLVTDQRLTTALPFTRAYFELGEPHSDDRTVPLDPAFLNKWDAVAGVSRFFDSGAIRMFDVRSIRDGK
jgi:hypothetical protein